MGHRANLLILNAPTQYELFYSHWAANTLPRDLFWGPEHAVRFVRAQRSVGHDQWLDDVWAEGGAVVDLHHRTLLLYGGEDVLMDVPFRRLYLQLLEEVWKPWKIIWALEGIAQIADYVRVSRDAVTAEDDWTPAESLSPPEQPGWTDAFVSIVDGGRATRIYPVAGDVSGVLAAGPRLLDDLPPEPARVDASALEAFPQWGVHLDLASDSLAFWSAGSFGSVHQLAEEAWKDWQVTWWSDEYERHAELADIPLPQRDPAQLLEAVVTMLLAEPGTSGVDTILDILGSDIDEGKDVKINPYALRDDRVDLDPDTRNAIVRSAVAGLVR